MSYDRNTQSDRAGPAIPLLRILGLVTLVVVLRGCGVHRANQAASPEACGPIEGRPMPAGIHADQLQGEFRLVLVATEGSQRGESASGDLVLLPNDSAFRRLSMPGGTYRTDAAMPLIGTASIALESVGGLRAGTLESSDPMRPGVAVLERHVVDGGDTTRSEITLRFGSEANRRDVTRFDGGFMALYVHVLTAEGFRGTWSSGVQEPAARGYFCAVRSDRD